MQHHEIFSRFLQYQGEVPLGYEMDFLGTQTDREFNSGLQAVEFQQKNRMGEYFPYPPVDEEYFEWIDLLEAVVAASRTFTMVELGAGYGRWAVRAAFAAQQYNPKLRCSLVAVEAEPAVYEWMKRHFRHNGIKPRWHTLLHGAVTGEPGKVEFCIGGPRGGEYDRAPNAWYGQFVTKDNRAFVESPRGDGKYCGFDVLRYQSGWRAIRIPAITVGSILKKLGRVDLIDMDIEGQELVALTSVAGELEAQVKRLHIGTHGKEIEAGLRQLLSARGWECRADYSESTDSETPWGTVHFENGVQSWVNPRL